MPAHIKCDVCTKIITDYKNDLFHHTAIIDGMLNKDAHLCSDCHKPGMVNDFDKPFGNDCDKRLVNEPEKVNHKGLTPKPLDSGTHYRVYYKEIQLDPYRLAGILGIADPAIFHAFKKVAFAGKRGSKDFKQDVIEARDALNRKLEMLAEDEQPA